MLRALGVLRALDRVFAVTALAWGHDGEDERALQQMLGGELHVVRRSMRLDGAVAEAMGLAAGLPAGYSRYGWFPSTLRRLLETRRFDAIHFDHPHTALSWPLVRRLQPQARLVLDAHNVEAEIIDRLADAAPPWQRAALRWQAGR